MANEAFQKGAQIGGVVRGVLDYVVGGDDMTTQAELAAQMFEGTGHPTGAQIAEVLRDNPQTGFRFLQQLGGTAAAYGQLSKMQAAAQQQQAIDAQNQAVIGQARIPIEGLQGVPGGLGPPAFNPNVPDPRVAGGVTGPTLPELEGLVTNLQNVADAGGDVSSTLDAIGKLQKLTRPKLTPANSILKEMGIDPDNYTGASLKAFIEHVQSGQPAADAYSLLQRRNSGDKPPAGYYFAEDEGGSVSLVPFQGTNAEIASIKSSILRKRMAGETLSEQEWATWDMLVNSNPITALLRGTLGNVSGSEVRALGGARGRATQADRDDAVETLRAKGAGKTPTEPELDNYLRSLGFEVP